MRMTVQKETEREECQRHAHECLDLVEHSTNSKTRATFAAMAATWLKLAREMSRLPSQR
jgi:hypothetical protein